MARPVDLPPAERFTHGTRSRYVSGCRCADCRAANTRYYHERQARGRELAALITPVAGEIPQLWTAPDGTRRERWYKRLCPGPGGGFPCPRDSHLRKDSKGGCCRVCRELLVWNGDVDAAPVRAHLKKLSRQGVGYKAVADACDVSKTVLAMVLAGKKHAVRKRTADRVLAVTREAAADHALVNAGPTWRLIGHMLAIGLTKRELARRLGYRSPALQIREDKVLARTAHAIRQLHAKVMEHASRQRAVDERAAHFRTIEEAA